MFFSVVLLSLACCRQSFWLILVPVVVLTVIGWYKSKKAFSNRKVRMPSLTCLRLTAALQSLHSPSLRRSRNWMSLG